MTTARTCPACRKRSQDGHLCHRCTRDLKQTLTRTGVLWVDLEVTIARDDNLTPEAEKVKGSNATALLFNPAASDLASAIRAALVSWVKLTMDEYHAPLPHDTVPALCRHLTDWLPSLRKHEAVTELHDELQAMKWGGKLLPIHRHILATIDHPDERSRVPAGPCPIATEGESCDGKVIAVFPQDQTAPAWIECPTCGWEMDSRHWDEAGDMIARRAAALAKQAELQREARIAAGLPVVPFRQDYTKPAPWRGSKVLLTIGDAALTYGIPERTLRSWLGSKLTRYGKPGLTLVAVDEMGRAHDSWLSMTARRQDA